MGSLYFLFILDLHFGYLVFDKSIMKPLEDVDPLTLRTIELLRRIDEASSTLLSRFCQIIEVVTNEGKDRCGIASESYQIEVHVASMIRSAEELLQISRLIKEAWILRETDTWNPVLEKISNMSMPSLDQILVLLEQYRSQNLEDLGTKSYILSIDFFFRRTIDVQLMDWQKSLTLIVALTLTRGIGLKNDLPWKLKSDMVFFSRVTSGLLAIRSTNKMNVVLMGRRTWESLPIHSKPLKNRINVVISRQEVLDLECGVHHARSLDDALALLSRVYNSENKIKLNRVFVIGGAELYTAAMKHPRLNRIIATIIYNEIDCDVFFPIDFRNSQASLSWRKQDHSALEAWVGSEVPQGKMNENGFVYEFEMWTRDIQEAL
ncbi:hypothetical protein PMAC_001000 [Pneumocystis sp. 'macacae']|nr:hypothetical protein PMAC_001000 [Pneumocystis sp. 'macacae']